MFTGLEVGGFEDIYPDAEPEAKPTVGLLLINDKTVNPAGITIA